MTLPKITHRQQDLLKLLYRFRFLDRIQLQALMDHKNRRRVNEWLSDLRAKQYVEWIYSTDFAEKTKPAVYFLGLNGVRFLKAQSEYPPTELRKRYREASRQSPFITSCLLLGDCAIDLRTNSEGDTRYDFATLADFANPGSEVHLLGQISCQLFVKKRQGDEMTQYLFDIFDSALPPYRVKSRIRKHLDFFKSGEWEDKMKTPFPILMFICADTSRLITAKRYTRWLLKKDGYADLLDIRFAIAADVRRAGVTSGIWERA
jgi:hypothetical protein